MLYLTIPKKMGALIYGTEYHRLSLEEEVLWRAGYVQGQQDILNSLNQQQNDRRRTSDTI